MHLFSKSISLLAISLLALLSRTPLFGAGESSANFITLLKPIPMQSMGRTGIAGLAGISALWSNPASLAESWDYEYAITGFQGMDQIHLVSLGVLIPTGSKGNFGLGLANIGAPPTLYVNEFGETTATELFYAHLVANISYAIRLPFMDIGCSALILNSRLGETVSVSVSPVLGISTLIKAKKITPMSGRNLSLALVYDDSLLTLPANFQAGTLSAGLEYDIIDSGIFGTAILADLSAADLKNPNLSVGAKFSFRQMIHLYSGYNRRTVNPLTFGLGLDLKVRKWNITANYALNPAVTDPSPLTQGIEITFKSLTGKLDHLSRAAAKESEKRLATGDFSGAEEELKGILTQDPGNRIALDMKRKIEAARSSFDSAAYLKKADALIQIKDYEKAKTELDNAIALDPGTAEGHLKKARIEYLQGQYKKALDNFQKVLDIEPRNEEALRHRKEILEKAEKTKPIWLQENYLYQEQRLVFEDFQEDSILMKFTSRSGIFGRISDRSGQYGRWELKKPEGLLNTSIRLPDLSKFNGIILQLRCQNFSRVDIQLVEQSSAGERIWEVPISGIRTTWQDLKLPFRYFQCISDPSAKLDLSKVIQIRMTIIPTLPEYALKQDMAGTIDIDKVSFYK